MAWHEACVGGCLACALEPLGGSELAYDDRSGLEPDSRNCVQKRAAILQLWTLFDMLLDLLLQVFNLALNLVE